MEAAPPTASFHMVDHECQRRLQYKGSDLIYGEELAIDSLHMSEVYGGRRGSS